ncbi:hypothetical protein ZHAS_00004154 [Anopheles sinensis]|uniref:Uncharacterized protein n=1 Tax=Anopheles sinensis TaxID=74873 RepID=A0A084VG63_ANOSI|nr:hypothetical protein ZHAS_00004154 [Anopheles sinensis]
MMLINLAPFKWPAMGRNRCRAGRMVGLTGSTDRSLYSQQAKSFFTGLYRKNFLLLPRSKLRHRIKHLSSVGGLFGGIRKLSLGVEARSCASNQNSTAHPT